MKEWYLTNPKPNITSGYENDSLSEYAQNNFTDVLETTFSDTALLFNYSLSESKEIKCVIQGNIANTQLKSMERTILVPIGTLNSGDYIFFEDEYWIVDGRPGNNKSYEKATLKECQYKLRWQKDDGTIVERWANLTSSSKYDVGENGNNTIILASNNYSIIIPNDNDSMTLDGKRVFIDLSDIPEKVFKITRNDDVLFAHGSHGGTLNLIADKVELNKETDNQELRLCDYIDFPTPLPPQPSTPDETADLWNMKIDCSNLEIKPTGYPKTLTATLYNTKTGETIPDIVYEWNVQSSISEFISYTVVDNVLKISLSKEYEDFGDEITITCNSKYTGQQETVVITTKGVF